MEIIENDYSDLKIISKEEYNHLKQCEHKLLGDAKVVLMKYRGESLHIVSTEETIQEMTAMLLDEQRKVTELTKELERINKLPWYKKLFARHKML